MTSSYSGETFVFWPISIAFAGRSGLSRAQAVPTITADPVDGTVTIITPAGIAVRIMAAPADLQAFLQMVGRVGVTGAEVSPGQLLLTTGDPGLQLSTRLGFAFEANSQVRGVIPQPDGTALMFYTNGEFQRMVPVFADIPGLLATVRTLPGVTQATANLDGTVTVVASGQPLRVRPDFAVTRSGAQVRQIQIEAATLVFDTGDGWRQRFTVVP